jgi:hypothetical protein
MTETQVEATGLNEASPIPPNGVHSFRAVDGRVITVTVARAKVPASLMAPLPPLVVASLMLLLVLAAAAASVWVVLS